MIGLNVDIIICLDNDVTLNEIYHICDKFYGIRNVYFIKDTEGILGEKDNITDVCEKDFIKLFKNKTKYTTEMHEQYIESMNNKGE